MDLLKTAAVLRLEKSTGDEYKKLRAWQALGLCVWDDPAWNYRSIFGWVTKNIE